MPHAAAQGLPFARGRLQAMGASLVPTAPLNLREDVMDVAGTVLVRGDSLPPTAKAPIAQLRRREARIKRADIWPGEHEIDMPLILAGGEVSILTAW